MDYRYPPAKSGLLSNNNQSYHHTACYPVNDAFTNIWSANDGKTPAILNFGGANHYVSPIHMTTHDDIGKVYPHSDGFLCAQSFIHQPSVENIVRKIIAERLSLIIPLSFGNYAFGWVGLISHDVMDRSSSKPLE